MLSFLDTTLTSNLLWIVAGGSLMILLGIAYLRFWLDLPSRIRLQILLAASLMAGGALGLELVEIFLIRTRVVYTIVVGIEELCEMMGSVVFAYAMLLYMQSEIGHVKAIIRSG
jgi:hypothetical protein